jgi:hypothetical protein
VLSSDYCVYISIRLLWLRENSYLSLPLPSAIATSFLKYLFHPANAPRSSPPSATPRVHHISLRALPYRGKAWQWKSSRSLPDRWSLQTSHFYCSYHCDCYYHRYCGICLDCTESCEMSQARRSCQSVERPIRQSKALNLSLSHWSLAEPPGIWAKPGALFIELLSRFVSFQGSTRSFSHWRQVAFVRALNGKCSVRISALQPPQVRHVPG